MNLINPYRAILFDFEGTLVDFQWKMDEAVHEVLAMLSEFGLDIDIFYGCDYAALFNRAIEESERLTLPHEIVREKIGEVYDRFDTDAVERWEPKDDVKYVLENLIKKSVLIALVTNAGKKAIDHFLQRFDLKRLLDVVVTRDDVIKLKPHAEGILKAIDILHVDNNETLFVGDSVTDIKATKDAGIDVVMVPGGESNILDIKTFKPKFIVDSLTDVLSLI